MSERLKGVSKETFVSITLNRASLGEASHVFAKIHAIPVLVSGITLPMFLVKT